MKRRIKNGNDENSGTKDSPFLTIEKAVEAVRNTDKAGKKGITVCIEGGEYRVSSLELTKEDSGTEECPVTYCSYNGEVIINGGITLDTADFKNAKSYERVPLALIAGGAIGNLIDRIRFGAVVDFLDFHIGGWHWPAFNIADICITVGVGLYLLNWYMARRKCLKSVKGGK